MNRKDFKVAWRSQPPDFLARVRPRRFALIVVDMQYYFAHPDFGVCAELKRAGRGAATRYFVGRLDKIIPNIVKLVRATRNAPGEIIFTRVQSATREGRERGFYHHYVGSHVIPGSRDAAILDNIGYEDNDMIVSKIGNGGFYSSSLDYILRNRGIDVVLVCGVTTDGCVEATVREAVDRAYKPVIIEDACAAWSQRSHEAGIWSMGTRYDVRSTRHVLRKLSSLQRRAKPRMLRGARA